MSFIRRNRRLYFINILAGLSLLLSGCATAPDKNRAGLDNATLLAIARDVVAANETWVDQAKFEKPTQNHDGTWSVRAARVPKVAGGHRFIVINRQGQVTGYFRDR